VLLVQQLRHQPPRPTLTLRLQPALLPMDLPMDRLRLIPEPEETNAVSARSAHRDLQAMLDMMERMGRTESRERTVRLDKTLRLMLLQPLALGSAHQVRLDLQDRRATKARRATPVSKANQAPQGRPVLAVRPANKAHPVLQDFPVVRERRASPASTSPALLHPAPPVDPARAAHRVLPALRAPRASPERRALRDRPAIRATLGRTESPEPQVPLGLQELLELKEAASIAPSLEPHQATRYNESHGIELKQLYAQSVMLHLDPLNKVFI